MAWCVVGGLCQQPVLNGSPDRCFYHLKLDQGLMADSFGKYHATPPGRPQLERDDDGWLTLAGPEPDLIDQLMGWEEKQLRALEGFRWAGGHWL